MKQGQSRAVFLDRDGVINPLVYYEDLGIVDSPFNSRQFVLYPGVSKAIALIHKIGKKAIIISNQPGMAKGFYSKKSFDSVNDKMRSLLKGGSFLDGVYYCLHHPEAKVGKYRKTCSCRKPGAGLIMKAALDHNIALKRSYMIGDGLTDIEAGKKAGCRTILIGRKKCDMCKLLLEKRLKPDIISESLLEAVKEIMKEEA